MGHKVGGVKAKLKGNEFDHVVEQLEWTGNIRRRFKP